MAAALEGRVRLLVFDNCEHVLDAAADLVEAILAQSATVRILATSREGLGVADEQVWLVPSLDLGGGNRLCRSQSVRRTRPECGAALLDRRRRGGGSGGGDLPAPRRDPVGHRAGGFPDGVDDRQRGAGSSRSSVPAAGRIADPPAPHLRRRRALPGPARRSPYGRCVLAPQFVIDSSGYVGANRDNADHVCWPD